MLELSKKYLEKKQKDLVFEDIENLQKLINYHSDLYYNKQNPIISDFEYDILFKNLEYLEKKLKIKNKQSKNVWAQILESSFEKVAHSRPMISLDNTYNEEDLADFDVRVKKNLSAKNIDFQKIVYDLEFKFDWLWVELIYKSWELVQAITRGNWIIWEDVTQNIFQVANIPKKIDYKSHLEIRWEIVMPNSSFEKLNKEAKENDKKIFSNPRNAASWSLRVKDISITKKRNLKFFAYDIANFSDFIAEKNISNYFEVIKKLQDLWFEISSYFKKFESIEKIIEEIKILTQIKNKTLDLKDFSKEQKEIYKNFLKIDFDIDWLVIKVDKIELWKQIWWTEHHPKYAISYKFPAEILTTKILSVEHSVWRTGTITPVANLEPINIWWVIVKRATLHNYEEVEKLWLKIWDNVFIKRAWEVIPKIISVIETEDFSKKDFIKPPEFCPSCSQKVLKDENKVRYYCDNDFCPAKNCEKLIFAVWKQWFDIDWLWKKQVELFLKLWIITDLLSVFDLENKKEKIISLEWFWEKSFSNLVKSLENAKNIELERFLTALWISGVWKKTAKTIKKLFKNEKDFLDFSYKIEDLEKLKDIWEEIAKNIYNYFTDEKNKIFLEKILKILNLKYFKEEKIEKKSYFYEKKVCITWSFEKDWEKISRDFLVEILERNAWIFVSSVSKNTDFLLAWEKVWSKLEKAKKLWVKIIDLEEFLEKTN